MCREHEELYSLMHDGVVGWTGKTLFYFFDKYVSWEGVADFCCSALIPCPAWHTSFCRVMKFENNSLHKTMWVGKLQNKWLQDILVILLIFNEAAHQMKD